jgi:hypothetical protein
VSGAVSRGASRALAALLSDNTRFAMPIRLLLEHDHAFTPEDVKVLIDAFEDTLRALRLHNRQDPLTMAGPKSSSSWQKTASAILGACAIWH